MILDAFGLEARVPVYLGPWPRLDRHGNVYWWQCLEPRCRFRTDPEARGGGLWWTQKRDHVATAHPGRDAATIGYPDSVRGIHIGGSPESYLQGEGTCVREGPTEGAVSLDQFVRGARQADDNGAEYEFEDDADEHDADSCEDSACDDPGHDGAAEQGRTDALPSHFDPDGLAEELARWPGPGGRRTALTRTRGKS